MRNGNGRATVSVDPVIRRIASGTSVKRARSDDARRFANHDGTPSDLEGRVEVAVARLEQVAERLEKALS